jgi:hypothetical protein
MKAREEMESELHSFLTLAINGGQLGQFSASRPLNRKLDGPQRQLDVLENRKDLLVVPVV